MDNLKKIKEKLESTIVAQLENGIENVDTQEMGMAIDMLKDIASTIYHCTLVKAMENSEYGSDYDEKGAYRNNAPYYPRPEDEMRGYMYYSGGQSRQGRPDTTYPSRFYSSDGNRGYSGRSDNVRRRYFESKDPSSKMQSLEDYANTLNEDLTEMASSASDNEKAMLKNKLQMIAQRL